MKKGFTIIEVSILLVIFLIVAFLVAPLSVDDTLQAKLTSKWRNVQEDFINIFHALNTQKQDGVVSFSEAMEKAIVAETKQEIAPYKISFLNGTYPDNSYRFMDYKLTYANAVVAIKVFEEPEGKLLGRLMYDVNGKKGPNTWGKDVFGMNLYEDKFEPYCRLASVVEQKQDCSKGGTGVCCSNYYLIGGSFD